MKKIFGISTIMVLAFLLIISTVSAQGLFGNDNKNEERSTRSPFGGSILKEGEGDELPEGDTGDPGAKPTPVEDGLLVLIGVAGIYMIKTYRDSKKQKA